MCHLIENLSFVGLWACLSICGVFYANTLSAQSQKDLFHEVREWIQLDQQAKAEQAIQGELGISTIENSGSLLRLARDLYQQNEQVHSFLAYELLLLKFPDMNDARLEYAMHLYNENQLEAAEATIQQYLNSGGNEQVALEMLANIYWWNWQLSKAKKIYLKILERDPDNTLALEGLEQVNNFLSPYLTLEYANFQDDQPLNSQLAGIGYKKYYNAWLAPELRLQYNSFSSQQSILNNTAFWGQLTNQFQWKDPGLELNLGGGLYLLDANSSPDLSYRAELKKDWREVGDISISAARSPYFTTLESVKETLSFDQYELKFSRPYEMSLNGEAAFRHRIFDDGNVGWNIYGYIMYSVLEFQKFSLKLGYGFNYDDMRTSSFLPIKDLDEILQSPGETIKGRYDPYFSPEEQMAHSALMNINWHVLSWMSLNGSASASVYARSEIPYLFLSRDDAGELIIARSFLKTDEQLVEYKLGMSFYPLPTLTLALEALYQELFFYKNKGLRVTLTMQLK